jgi:DNA polymerase III delta prime subunit
MKKEIWWEKHRPQDLDSFMGQESIVEEVRLILEGKAPMQHFLFSSTEPGTGKTTLAYIVAEVLGWQLHKFNASSKKTRGIEFIEEYIIPMSRIGQWETIFFLDEADRLTPQAQDALKGVIEDAQGYFILTCNDISKVSPWLQSRCQVRTFEPIPAELVEQRLAQVAAFEGVEVDAHAVRVIAKKHRGDLRNSIGALQKAAYLDSKQLRKFVAELESSGFDADVVLRLCMSEKSIQQGVSALIENRPHLTRERVREVFLHAIESPASQKAKVKVLDAAIVSERDILNGVDPLIVAHNFCRLLAE